MNSTNHNNEQTGMFSYEDIKHKPKTLMAMTSLNRSEFDGLLGVFAKAWDEETGRDLMDPCKGGGHRRLKAWTTDFCSYCST
jgi:hypothetical protein